MSQNLLPVALSIDGAVNYSGMSRTRIYDLMKTGALPSFTVGCRRMIRRDALDAFIDQVSGKAA